MVMGVEDRKYGTLSKLQIIKVIKLIMLALSVGTVIFLLKIKLIVRAIWGILRLPTGAVLLLPPYPLVHPLVLFWKPDGNRQPRFVHPRKLGGIPQGRLTSLRFILKTVLYDTLVEPPEPGTLPLHETEILIRAAIELFVYDTSRLDCQWVVQDTTKRRKKGRRTKQAGYPST
jgi:hypothetical protein